jgi:hypothetical protein
VEPASAVPVKVGVVLVVAFAAGEVITGAAGTGVMVKVLGVELALPPGVVEVTVTLWLPSPSGVVGVHEKWPMASVVAVQTVVPSTVTATVEPGSDRPVKAGVCVLVVLPAAGVCKTGVVGTFATVKGVGAVVAETLPAASVALAVVECMPGVSGWVTGQLKVPCAVAVTSHTTWPSTRTVTVLEASAVPVMVGVGLVCWPEVGLVMTGSAGATVSMVNGTGGAEPGLVPPAVVAVAVTWCGPSPSGVVGAHTK